METGFRKRSCAKNLFGEGDRIDVTAIIRLGPVRGPAVAEEARGVRVGAETNVLDSLDFSAIEPRSGVAGQIEHCMAGARRRSEEALVRVIRRRETVDEFRAHLVVRLAD